MNSELADELNMETTAGVYVDSVIEGSAAQEAGLRKGDVVIEINGVAVNSAPELQEQIGRFRPGDKVNVTFIRNNRNSEITVELKNISGNTTLVSAGSSQSLKGFGLEVKPVDEETKNDLRITGGVQITRISDGKIARNTDIKTGFIITKVDNRPVFSADDLEIALSKKTGSIMIEGMYPNKQGIYYYSFGL
jgi:S1-C subfamily serine protease